MSDSSLPEKLNPEFAHKIFGGVITSWSNVCTVCGKKAGLHTGNSGQMFCNGAEAEHYKKQAVEQAAINVNAKCICATNGPHSNDGQAEFVVKINNQSAVACINHVHVYASCGWTVTPILRDGEFMPHSLEEYEILMYGRNFPDYPKENLANKEFNSWQGGSDVPCATCHKAWHNHWGPFCSAKERDSIRKFYDILSGKFGGKMDKMDETVEYVVPTPSPRRTKAIHLARTQKAKGLAVLAKDYTRETVRYELIDADKAEPQDLVNRFVRPCPMRPRHGFVDSRFVSNEDEAKQIIKETLAADAEAEFVLANKIDAEFSGIWTKGYLTVGKGNDGATAGHSAKMIPVLGTLTNEYINKAASVEHAPYLELLFKYKRYIALGDTAWKVLEVQLRDGPELPALSSDYIPSEVKVTNVILADGDLLEWESKVLQFAAGTVVYHPNGSMASHYAIHAVLAKVPVLITREPKVGETLKPNQSQTLEPNLRDFMAGYVFGTSGEITMKEAAYAMLAGLHHTSVWLGRHDVLLGLAIGCAWRLTVTAGLGEARHVLSRRRRHHKKDRNTVYTDVWNKTDKPATRRKFRTAIQGFLDRDYDDGFGGESWYRFTQWAVKMHNALLAGNIKGSLNYLNQLVHSAHNNGWGFDKFLNQSDLQTTADNPVYAALRCAVTLYRAANMDVLTRNNMAESFTHYRRPLADTEIIDGGKRINKNGELVSASGDVLNEDGEYDEEEEEEEEEVDISELPVKVVQVKPFPDSMTKKIMLHVQVGHQDTDQYEKYDLPTGWTLEQFQTLTAKGFETAPSLSGAATEYVVIPESLGSFDKKWWIKTLMVYSTEYSIPEIVQYAKNDLFKPIEQESN